MTGQTESLLSVLIITRGFCNKNIIIKKYATEF